MIVVFSANINTHRHRNIIAIFAIFEDRGAAFDINTQGEMLQHFRRNPWLWYLGFSNRSLSIFSRIGWYYRSFFGNGCFLDSSFYEHSKSSSLWSDLVHEELLVVRSEYYSCGEGNIGLYHWFQIDLNQHDLDHDELFLLGGCQGWVRVYHVMATLNWISYILEHNCSLSWSPVSKNGNNGNRMFCLLMYRG